MKALDYLKALGVAVAVLVITLAASFPMVAFYHYVIEPGHPPEFYQQAALWIAPWSSYILGPLVFLGLNYWLARRTPGRSALLFAAVGILLYIIVDLILLGTMMGIPFTDYLNPTMALSLSAKLAGALLGAWMGSAGGAVRARG